MDLVANFGPGKKSEGAVAEMRPLCQEDLVGLEVRPEERQPLKQIRHKHHALARALANGLSETEAGIVSGFTQSTVSVLKTDPAFRELVKFYEGEASRVFNAMQEKLFGVSMAALEELEARLETDPQKMGSALLKELVQMGADRTGNGPQTTQNVNVNIGLADRMAAAQKRLEATRTPPAIQSDVTYTDISEAAE
jgi:hypothetical protein